MSRELMRALFERDLSLTEMERISTSLRTSADDAAYLAELAAVRYQDLGLKRPKAPKRANWKLWGAFGGGMALLMAGLALGWPKVQPEPVIPVQAPEALARTGTTEVAPAKLKSDSTMAPKPTAFAEGEQMRVEVELPRAMQVQVDLFNEQGKRLRQLFKGLSPAGTNGYVVDGKDFQGNALAPGRYRVVVDYGAGILEKWFEAK